MSYDIKRIDYANHNVEIVVKHTVPGRGGTTIETEIAMHLTECAVNPKDRVSAMSIDICWVTAPTVPEFAAELARVLERVAAGLREGPRGTLLLLTGPVSPPVV